MNFNQTVQYIIEQNTSNLLLEVSTLSLEQRGIIITALKAGNSLSKAFEKAGIEYGTEKGARLMGRLGIIKVLPELADLIKDDYNNKKMTTNDICRKYGFPRSTLFNIFKKCNISTRRTGPALSVHANLNFLKYGRGKGGIGFYMYMKYHNKLDYLYTLFKDAYSNPDIRTKQFLLSVPEIYDYLGDEISKIAKDSTCHSSKFWGRFIEAACIAKDSRNWQPFQKSKISTVKQKEIKRSQDIYWHRDANIIDGPASSQYKQIIPGVPEGYE